MTPEDEQKDSMHMPRKPLQLPRVPLGKPILERAYTIGRSRRAVVTLRIGRPRPVAGWDWACPVQVVEAGKSPGRIQPVFGIDAFQSLVLALEYARINLTIPDRGLRFLDSPVSADFPVYPLSLTPSSP